MIYFERVSSYVLSKLKNPKKEIMKINQEIRILERFLRNMSPKGSPGFERVLPGYFFQKMGFSVRHFFSPILMLDASNKLHFVGNQ